jgi:glycosyltransferase involved in cell wall biosynthesis
MAGYLGLPRDRMHVVYPGINLKGHGTPPEFRDRPPFTIGYFARICPEKGLHNLVDAFRLLRYMPDAPPCRLKISGWLGSNNHHYFEAQMAKLRDAGLGDAVEHVDCPSHDDKVRFLQSLDVLSVPTTYREPKGIYVLEALANQVPVVQPRHGSFPELIEATGGGLLVEPDDPPALAHGLVQLLTNAALRRQMGEAGQKAVFARFTADQMAAETATVLSQYHQEQRRPAEAIAP